MEPAKWFTIGWEQAYERRANAYYGPMPSDEQRRMLYARDRADKSLERENKQRIANGKVPLWDGSIKNLVSGMV